MSKNKQDQLLENTSKSGVASRRQSLWLLGHCQDLPRARSDRRRRDRSTLRAAEESRRTVYASPKTEIFLQEASAFYKIDTFRLLPSAGDPRVHRVDWVKNTMVVLCLSVDQKHSELFILTVSTWDIEPYCAKLPLPCTCAQQTVSLPPYHGKLTESQSG